MKIKTKLTLGVGLLFLLIFLLSLFSINWINSLANDADNILKDNHKTLEYTRNMLKALSEVDSNNEAFSVFEENLRKQNSNITEIGEKEITEKLNASFLELKDNPANTIARHSIEECLFEIMSLNLNAIYFKGSVASKTSSHSFLWICLLSTICFLIALVILVKLPGNISNPINELNESIKQIAANNYSQKVNFEKHNEFGELAKSFNIMAVKLDAYNKSNLAKLIIEKRITETLINKIHDPIIGVDNNMKVLFCNEEFTKVTNQKHEEIIGANILELASADSLLKEIIIMNSTPEGEPQRSNVHVERKGKDIFFEKEIQIISLAPIGEEAERVYGYVIILRNITKFIELDIAKTNFIATISHELKTPISSIKLSLQLLNNEKTGSLNNDQHELIKSVEEDTEHILKIVGEILNLAQVETGNIQIHIKPTPPEKILLSAIGANKQLADKKRLTFQLNITESLPNVLADSEKTGWVLTNIIANAIQYSNNESTIFLSIALVNHEIQFCIKDTGRGIPEEYIDKVFNKYFKVPGSKSEGTGLGLAICKEFIEAQGGSITVESEVGIGSAFTVKLIKEA